VFNFIMSQNRLGLLEFLEHCCNLRKAQSEVCWLNFCPRIESHDVLVSPELFFINQLFRISFVLKDICMKCVSDALIIWCYPSGMCSRMICVLKCYVFESCSKWMLVYRIMWEKLDMLKTLNWSYVLCT